MTQIPNVERSSQEQKVKPDRRSFLLQVILPLVVGVLALFAAAYLLLRGGVGTASAWADASLIFLLIPWLCAGLIPIALFAGLWYGLFKLTAWLPAPLRKVDGYINRAGRYVRQGTDVAVRPLFVIKGGWAVMMAFVKGLASLFGLDDGESDE